MFHFKPCLVCCLILWSSSFFAQKSFTNGVIFYDLRVKSDQFLFAIMDNAVLSASFNGGMSKYEISVMGGVLNASFTVDDRNRKGLVLMNLLGERKAVELRGKNYEKIRSQVGELLDVNQAIASSETEKILGYTCKEVSLPEASHGNALTLYVTGKIHPKGNNILDRLYKKTKGFPLNVIASAEDNEFNILAKEILHKTPNKSNFKFSIPNGYERVSVKDFLSIFGGN